MAALSAALAQMRTRACPVPAQSPEIGCNSGLVCASNLEVEPHVESQVAFAQLALTVARPVLAAPACARASRDAVFARRSGVDGGETIACAPNALGLDLQQCRAATE